MTLIYSHDEPKTLYFLVVSFVLQNPTALDRALFVFYKPNFETHAECFQFANKNNHMIYYMMMKNE